MTETHDATEERVRARAYEHWERAGREEGRPEYYWRQARFEIDAENAEPGDENPRILTQDGLTTLPPGDATS